MSSDLLDAARLLSRTYTSRGRSFLSFLSVFGVIQVKQVLLSEWENLAPSGSGGMALSSLGLSRTFTLSLGRQLPAALETPNPYSSVPILHILFLKQVHCGYWHFPGTQGVSRGTHLLQCGPVRATSVSSSGVSDRTRVTRWKALRFLD